MKQPSSPGAILIILSALVACSSPATGALHGQALLGPTCPVIIEGRSCDDLPAADRIVEFYAGGGRLVAQIRTASDGSFAVELPAGHYRLQLQLSGIETMEPIEVEITPGMVTRVTLHIDTGIR